MYNKIEKEVRVFTLPGEEMAVNNIMNNEEYTIVDETKVPCPKEGVILLYLKWERRRRDE